VNTLRQIPGVTEVKEDRDAVELHAAEAEPVVRELLARDAQLCGLEITSAGLEEAFLALTHDTARDGKEFELRRTCMPEGDAMSTAPWALSNTQIQRSSRHTATIYLKEAKYEFLKNLRLRMYTASVLSFPVMFYFVLVGLVLNAKQAIGGTTVPTYLIATTGRSV